MITAKEQMDFQREMSNTAHQREVADLKAAGLNPVLSAGGSGASTPVGAMDSGSGQASSAKRSSGSSVRDYQKIADSVVKIQEQTAKGLNDAISKLIPKREPVPEDTSEVLDKTRRLRDSMEQSLRDYEFANPMSVKPSHQSIEQKQEQAVEQMLHYFGADDKDYGFWRRPILRNKLGISGKDLIMWATKDAIAKQETRNYLWSVVKRLFSPSARRNSN